MPTMLTCLPPNMTLCYSYFYECDDVRSQAAGNFTVSLFRVAEDYWHPCTDLAGRDAKVSMV
jgi:hypothetical protein